MDSKQFITQLAAASGFDAAETRKLTESLAGLIRRQCSEEGAVAFPGFGTFTGVKHPEEISTDLATGRRVLLPPAIDVKFTPGSMLKRSLN